MSHPTLSAIRSARAFHRLASQRRAKGGKFRFHRSKAGRQDLVSFGIRSLLFPAFARLLRRLEFLDADSFGAPQRYALFRVVNRPRATSRPTKECLQSRDAVLMVLEGWEAMLRLFPQYGGCVSKHFRPPAFGKSFQQFGKPPVHVASHRSEHSKGVCDDYGADQRELV
jgi:hypothetical protein